MNGVLPALVTFPLALAAMLLVSAHVTATQQSGAPASRKRIRIVNGWVMLLTLPLIAAGLSVVSGDQPRLFTLVWLGVVLLLFLSIMLAILDALNTVRLAREDKRRNLIDFAKAKYAAERDDE